MKKRKFKWALVLSGGGARGFAHVGVLNALEEAGFPGPSLIVGTSMGAIVGGLYACGMPAREITRYVLDEFKIGDYLESFVFRLDGPVGQFIQTGQVLASLATRPGVDKGHKLLELFERLTAGKTFEETGIPFRCNAVDLFNGREVVFNSGSVAKAIRASMSFPVFFEPLVEGGMCLVDGGLFDNMPVVIARNEGYRHVMAVNVNRFDLYDEDRVKNAPQIIFRSMECVLRARERDKKHMADLTLNVTDDATPFSFYRKREFIRLGERVVNNNIKCLERFFKSSLRRFRSPVVCGIV